MLVGRARECEVIDDLLATAAQGRSGALVIRGGTGVGKSSLVEYALARARGFTALTATGVEAERDFAYAGLQEVLAPALSRLDRIPEVQADALRGALALTEPAHVGRMYIGAAALSLMSSSTDDGPVVVAIDDAQWLDAPSAEALVFAARRVKAEAVAIVFVANLEVGRFVADGIPELAIEGLADDDAAALLRSRVPAVAEVVVDHLVAATGGNPLFLIQIAKLLTQEQLSGREPIPHPLPIGQGLADWYVSRLETLSDDARRATVLAAASDTGGVRVLARADDPTAHALAEAEEAGILTVDGGRVAFVHPLVRAAVYSAASPGERRDAHRHLADALVESRYRERRAWHLAAAATGTDEAVAADIAAVAASAAGRRAHAPAAALYAKAAELTIDQEFRAELLTDAAWSYRLTGRRDRARELARRAIGDATIARTRARARCVEALTSLDSGVELPVEELIADARAVAGDEPELAARALAIASELSDADRAVELADDSLELAPQGSSAAAFATVAGGRALSRVGRDLDAAATIAQAAALLSTHPHLHEDPEVLVAVVDGLAEVRGDVSSMEGLLTIASRAAREHTLVVLPRALVHRSRIEHRQGRWRDAHVHGYEAARLFRETGQAVRARAADAWLGTIEAAFGHEDAVDAIAASLDDPIAEPALDRIHGVLQLAIGRPERAAAPLRRFVTARADGPTLLEIDPLSVADAVEASLRAGDRVEAEAIRGCVPLDQADAPVCVAWIDAMLGDEESAFDEILTWLDDAPPYLAARIRLAAGQHIRRGGAKRDARIPLRLALDGFSRIDATTWAERAAAELRATGERVERVGGSTLDELTPQELQVARLIAGGATYKEAAARLYLAPKTIEFHIGKVYRKLGLRGGVELAALFAREDEAT